MADLPSEHEMRVGMLAELRALDVQRGKLLETIRRAQDSIDAIDERQAQIQQGLDILDNGGLRGPSRS